jgi:hypothetical protein
MDFNKKFLEYKNILSNEEFITRKPSSHSTKNSS